MKQFIILCSTIMLGMVIYNLILGPGDDSLANTVGKAWEQGIEIRTESP